MQYEQNINFFKCWERSAWSSPIFAKRNTVIILNLFYIKFMLVYNLSIHSMLDTNSCRHHKLHFHDRFEYTLPHFLYTLWEQINWQSVTYCKTTISFGESRTNFDGSWAYLNKSLGEPCVVLKPKLDYLQTTSILVKIVEIWIWNFCSHWHPISSIIFVKDASENDTTNK